MEGLINKSGDRRFPNNLLIEWSGIEFDTGYFFVELEIISTDYYMKRQLNINNRNISLFSLFYGYYFS